MPAVDVRLVLPAGWLGADADDIESLGEVPAVSEALDELEGSVLVFAGADTRGVDGSPVGDNLTVYDLGAAVPEFALEVGAEVIAASLETVPEVQGSVKVTIVSLPIGEAASLRFTYASEVELTVEAYAFNAGSHLVLAAFTAPASQADSARSVFATIADSFREL